MLEVGLDCIGPGLPVQNRQVPVLLSLGAAPTFQ